MHEKHKSKTGSRDSTYPLRACSSDLCLSVRPYLLRSFTCQGTLQWISPLMRSLQTFSSSLNIVTLGTKAHIQTGTQLCSLPFKYPLKHTSLWVLWVHYIFFSLVSYLTNYYVTQTSKIYTGFLLSFRVSALKVLIPPPPMWGVCVWMYWCLCSFAHAS